MKKKCPICPKSPFFPSRLCYPPTERKLLTLALDPAAFGVEADVAATRFARSLPQRGLPIVGRRNLGRLIGERRDAELRQCHQRGSRNPRPLDPLAF
jgi:hypothetical protein